ncbi:MAG: TIGR02588 family protein [Acidobacteriota bacterium]|nr:TIGR02588 family protein [Acidobacteriota bacterium]
MAEEKEKKENRGRQKETPVWEWIIAAVGLILVVAALGTTLYRAVTEESTPPILEISVKAIVPTSNGYLVEFRVKNTGNQTAAALTIEGELKRGAESVETSTASLAYAPANSQREGGLFFTKNPNEFELNIRALGYEKP